MTLLERVTAFLKENQVTAYLVGGSVRDQLLARADTRDLDLAVAGDAARLARAFADAERGAFYLMDAEHNVARVILESSYVDFAALRGDLQADLSTRDFTVNAMAIPLDTGQIVDVFGGLADLTARRIRAISPLVFERDPVRLLRAVRIAGELGFTIEPETAMAMRGSGLLLERASMERARDELFKILAQSSAADLLQHLDDLGLLVHLLPEVTGMKEVRQSSPHVYSAFVHSLHTVSNLVQIQAQSYLDVANGKYKEHLEGHFAEPVSADRTRGLLLRLIALLHDIGKVETSSVGEDGRIHFIGHETRGALFAEAVLHRLRMSRSEIEIASRVIREHLRPPQLARGGPVTTRAVYRFFRATGKEGVDVCVLALADTRAKGSPSMDFPSDNQLRETLTTLLDHVFGSAQTAIAPPAVVDGRALMDELQLPPGPEIGRLLESIREAQAIGEVRTREQAIAYARGILEDDLTNSEH